MKLDDLLDMLRAEFALDVPATQDTLLQWQAQPETLPAGLPDMLSLLDRSAEVVEIVGMHGLAAFLLQVRTFSELISRADTVFAPPDASGFTRAASLKWLASWVDKVVAYLDKPADPASVEAIAKYLYRCPLKPDTDAVLELAEQLTKSPSLPSDDPDTTPLEQASDADVSLSTEDVDGDLLQALLVDAPQQLEQLEAVLQHWATCSATAAEMQEAQRIAHTFKGSGNIIGLPGIGRVAHRLEDILEYALEAVGRQEAANPAMVRDSLRAVLSLQQMTAFLQGEESEPFGSKQVLQRLLDWVQWIRDGQGQTANPEALDGVVQPVLVATPINNASAGSAADAAPAAAIGDSSTLRVGVDRLSRLLRRAGQSIVQTQRLTQLLQSANDRLEAVAISQKQLTTRLREMETIVGSQAVALRQQQKENDFDPLEMDRYDALHLLSRSISEALQDGQELVQQIQQDTSSASATLRDEGYAQIDQHRELLAARLIPVKTMVPRLKRNVAQTASVTGKQVVLQIQGDSVTIDADVLSSLTEPLLHLLRNAVDHGIEMPDERLRLGKPAHGTVTVAFKRVGQEVEINVTDDGRGLDLSRIEEKARAYGLIAPDTQLSEVELRRMILRPGFSTRDKVTEVSGRGVGMDVVSDRIAALKGRLSIDSTAQVGSRFKLNVPVSSGVAHALVVQCAQESVALSTDQVLTVLPAGQATFSREGEQLYLLHEGVRYRAYVLSHWLGFEETVPTESHAADRLLPVLVKGQDEAHDPVALLVDAVLDSRELILQGIGQLTRRIRGVVAGALRADGKPLFLIDVAELERAARSSVKLVSSSALRKRLAVERTRVLIVDDALSVRRSMQQLLGDAGYDVASAADGFEAIEQIRLKRPSIVLTDLEMPNLNGLELTRRVREVPQWMDLPIVMITSRAGDKHRQIAAEAGVDVYLTKPYLDADLLNHVRTLCAADTDILLD